MNELLYTSFVDELTKMARRRFPSTTTNAMARARGPSWSKSRNAPAAVRRNEREFGRKTQKWGPGTSGITAPVSSGQTQGPNMQPQAAVNVG
jgi:hypothetical protein